MLPHHHPINTLFPEYEAEIHALKMREPSFAKLLEDYHAADKEIVRIEQGIEQACDTHLDLLKKQRLQLEDKILGLLKQAS